MNGPAAKELINVMMLDDYVDRMAGVRKWEERWVSTLDLMVEFKPSLKDLPEPMKMEAMREGVKSLTKSILHALRDESQHVTRFDYTDDRILMKVVFVRMEPQE